MTRIRPRSRSLLAAALLGLVALGCGGDLILPPTGLTRDFVEARAKWRAQGLTDYDYTLQVLCFCGDVRPMRIAVRGGVVASVTPVGEVVALPAEQAQWYPSVEGLFDVVAAAIAQPAASLQAEYDALRGFPRTVAVDHRAEVADDEFTYIASAVVAR